ncbi:GNAT family N-acetyltransferase [Paenibacillus sp. FSL K6-2524]|uniref:GNAT family N-acetyltransferase n=1 Tax=Paenibacillus sp. FSL K6-2524 TaxID=2954516 RepID=UPI0030FA3F07
MEMMDTERLVIRRFVPEDGEDLYQYLSLPEVVLYEPYPVFSKEDCFREALRRYEEKDNNAFWAVCLKHNNKMIGHLYFKQVELEHFMTWTLGYVFNPNYYSQGYATESARRILQYGFEELHCHRIIAGADIRNTASWRLLERLGMRREAHMLQNATFKRTEDGEPIWVDSYHYAILASKWM